MSGTEGITHISELFGRQERGISPLNHRFFYGNNYSQNRTSRGRSFTNSKSFFTLRLEHREGGSMAQNRGEERVLLFRSDRAGAIGKIIYSSTPSKKRRKVCSVGAEECFQNFKTSALNSVEEELSCMAQAKIHVLDVKEEYRGMDLGGLLFAEAIRSLRRKYSNDEDCKFESLNGVRCQLEAEEDLSRHNKLINFYEQLGCHVKPNSRFQILYNNDGTTYRKVPMQIAVRRLNNRDVLRSTMKRKAYECSSSLLMSEGNTKMFLPVHFLKRDGTNLRVPLRKINKDSSYSKVLTPMKLLIVQEENGLSFQSTQGHKIQVDNDGNIIAVSTEDENIVDKDVWSNPLDRFQVTRVSDIIPKNRHEFDENNQIHPCLEDEDNDLSDSEEAKVNKLWILRTSQGLFLGADQKSGALALSKEPMFWKSDNDTLSLICTNDTPGRRWHYRNTWAKQSVAYVMKMRERYFDFGLTQMTLREALEKVKELKCHPFRVKHNGPNLRTFLFQTAEYARKECHPDWVQLLAIIHELGRVVSCIDKTSSSENEDYNWTFAIRARVLGCTPPSRANFGEFRNLNPDLSNEQSNTTNGIYQAHCGMEKLLLSWTGPEYMYFMLNHNGVSLPDEGFGVLRLFQLGDWHTHGEYLHFCSEVDNNMKDFVVDFDKMRKSVRRDCLEDLSDDECDLLWEQHYGKIAQKYDCGHVLNW